MFKLLFLITIYLFSCALLITPSLQEEYKKCQTDSQFELVSSLPIKFLPFSPKPLNFIFFKYIKNLKFFKLYLLNIYWPKSICFDEFKLGRSSTCTYEFIRLNVLSSKHHPPTNLFI